jgi:hemerythrin-like domain-containing protein
MTQTAQRDMISVLTQDHRDVEELFVRLEELANTRDTPDTSGERAEARQIADQVITELSRHWAAEERHLYPALREYVPACLPLADLEVAEHAKAERNLKSLDWLDPDDEEFWIRVEVLIAVIRAHTQIEEEELFPRLRAAVPREELIDLGGKVERTEHTGPTRPHPAVPDTPPGNKLAEPAAALLDRVRDALSDRGRGSEHARNG